MASDELTKPLGLEKARGGRRWLLFAAILAPPLVFAVAAGGYLLSRHAGGPSSGGGAVGAAIEGRADTTGSIAATPAGPPPAAVVHSGPGLTEVTPDGSLDDVGGDVVITDPSKPRPIRLAAAPRQDMVESGAYGLLPRIGDDGVRPMDAYARPADIPAGMIPIAIVVGGIGLEGEGSDGAVSQLPGEITLAIAPYGDDLPRILAAARSAGHEILLQVPLEPYNYPDVDPGPKTLTTDAPAKENIDRLHWLMSRITTYVGVMNYMGARFTSEDDALSPVLAEIGRRGLLYVDDGSSARSLAAGAARGTTPVLRADVVLDADTTPGAIDDRLDQLAAIARERGYAVATATAFPATVDRVAAFAARAADRGIVLVPVSALVQAGRS